MSPSSNLRYRHKKRGSFSKLPQDNENETWILSLTDDQI